MFVHVENLKDIMCTKLQIILKLSFREDFFKEMTLKDRRVLSRSRRNEESCSRGPHKHHF